MFDYIYVFAQGRVVEQGSYPALIAKGGELARLVRNYSAAEQESDAPAGGALLSIP